ncbi:MAG: substrate-binding domain-containing protein [Ruminococcus sp.]
MKSKGRIGVVIPAVVESIEADLLNEIYNLAKESGYDVIVFTNSSNALDSFTENDYIHGEEKIYELLNIAELDGILFAAGRFHSQRVIRYITDIIRKSNTPCVVLEMKISGFPYVYPSQREDIFKVTEHLITVHGYEKIYCLTGPEGIYEAEERLAGFRMAMEQYDLNSDNYSYGDFWINSPKKLAKDIADKKIEMPEAVVCTNDSMAIALCDELKVHGIKVPEQIAVTGYDGSFEAFSYEPVITTVVHKQKELAFKAFSKLCEIMSLDFSLPANEKKYNIRYGESCGCFPKKNNYQKKIQYNITHNKQLQELYLNSNLMEQMSSAKSLQDFKESIINLKYLIPNLTQLDICLCDNWNSEFSHGKAIENNTSYTQQMMLLLSNSQHYNERDIFLFETRDILPFLLQEHEPQCIVLLPIHYLSWNIGYMAMYYENGTQYHVDTFLQYWRDSLANGLHTLKDKMDIEHMNKVIEEYSIRDQLTGMLNKKGFLKACTDFIRGTQKMGNHCLMLVFSWFQYVSPPTNTEKVIDIVFSNALSMLCANGRICARIGEKIYSAIIQLNNIEKADEEANKFFISLEQTLLKLQGQPVSPEMPDINCDFSVVTSSDEIENFLDSLNNAARKANDIKKNITDYSVQLKRIRKEMYLSPQLDWTSESIAEKLGLSDGYFRKLYKSQFNISFKEDHINSRITKAKTLLSDTNLTVAEVAAKCGFKNASHFMRTFKAKEGKTAVQFRKEQ